MKKTILLVLVLASVKCFSQEADKSDEQAVMDVVNQFFEALEKQDTFLYKKILFTEGQIWSVNNTQNPRSHDMRYFQDDLKAFSPQEILQEKPLSFDIKIHNGMAMAWVPYEFRINGKFSHCGVDVFILIKTKEGWKIVNASYTVDKIGCEELKN